MHLLLRVEIGDRQERQVELTEHDPQGFVEVDGEPWGWLPRARPIVKEGVAGEAAFTEAEPTLWVVSALAAALQRPEYLEPAERTALGAELARAQTARRAAVCRSWPMVRSGERFGGVVMLRPR